jgi:hypothetical protein
MSGGQKTRVFCLDQIEFIPKSFWLVQKMSDDENWQTYGNL